MRVSWLLWLVAGCSESISLGTDCPPSGSVCRDEAAPQSATASDAGSDAVARGAADAAMPLVPDGAAADSQVEAATAQFPGFQNPSLEITGGAASGGLISSFAVQVTPWLGCGPPGFGPGAYPQADLRADATSGAPAEGDILRPADGGSLLVISPDGTSVGQTLSSPLVAGTRYAFAIDLASSLGATDVALEVQGSSGCLSPETLTTTEPARVGAWAAVCVTFTPDKAYSSLMLTAVSSTAASSARLFIDHIRSDVACR